MKQLLLFLTLLFLIFLTGCSDVTITQNEQNEITLVQETKQNLSPTTENFLTILATNKDGKEYLEKYSNTKITYFKKITPNEFESLKNNTNYKELFTDLPNKELYQVDFNGGSSLSLTTVIDLEDKKVLKIYGIYIMGMG